MQKDAKVLAKGKIQVVAVSYDSVEVLSAFAKSKEITLPLLADVGSKTIDAWGLRNKQAGKRIDGVPHPGTIVVDADGKVMAKLFHDGYKKRHDAKAIIAAVQSARKKQEP